MLDRKARLCAAVSALTFIAAAAHAADTPADTRIRELEAKVAALEARQSRNGQDVAATIDGVLRDAERRSQLLANGADMGAGYDGGFFIRSGDAWLLRPGVFFQFRNVTNYREETGGGKDDEVENGFEVRRLKLELSGTAFTKDLEYNFVWASGRSSDSTSTGESLRNGGALILEDAWVKYRFSDEWAFRAGQFKDPWSHEELLLDKRQLAVERSLVNALVGGAFTDRVQGVSLIYGDYAKENPLAVELVFHDGANSNNTGFAKAGGADFGLAARADYKLFGDWRSYRDFSAWGNKEDLLVLGAGGDWTQFGGADQYLASADAQWESANGLNAYAAANVRHVTEELTDAGDDSTDFGLLVQGGYLLNPAWEIFARWGWIHFDNGQPLSLGGVAAGDTEDNVHELTVGLNYYLGENGSAAHRAKVTVDLTYLPNATPSRQTGLGYLDDNGGDDEWVVRGQFQLLL